MPKQPSKPAKKPTKPRSTKLEAERKRAAIIQDITAGFGTAETAKRNDVSTSYVSQIQRENEESIRAAHAASLDARQEKINAFIEKTHEDLMEICNEASELLKAALKANAESVKKNIDTTIETRKKIDGKIVISSPSNDLARAVKIWKDIFGTWSKLQRLEDGEGEDES